MAPVNDNPVNDTSISSSQPTLADLAEGGKAVDDRPIDPATGKPLAPAKPAVKLTQAPGEEDGPKGPEPTRYGDWERKGIVSDF